MYWIDVEGFLFIITGIGKTYIKSVNISIHEFSKKNRWSLKEIRNPFHSVLISPFPLKAL